MSGLGMERNDSSAAISSIASYAGDSSSDEEPPENKISDDDMDLDSDNGSRPPSRSLIILNEPIAEGRGSKAGSVASSTNSPSLEKADAKKVERKPTKLVSYQADDMDDDEDLSSDEESGDVVQIVTGKDMNSSLSTDMASSLSRAVQNMLPDDIKIPPEPLMRCERHIQDKITKSYDRMRYTGEDMNHGIKSRKDFRNPSIYEKLIEFCEIDEKGTNYPPEIFDPYSWGKESYYESLAEAQKKEMERREKERRTKVDFMSGTKKGIENSTSADEKKRKSKWDNHVPPSRPPIHASLSASNLATISASSSAGSASQSKTFIPAVGNLKKSSTSK